ncbi:MAG TPA: tetraacyldisaccharide 4'-kinase [Labilithrix sp.]
MIRTAIARTLEAGVPLGRPIAKLHGVVAARAIARPLIAPRAAKIVCVGGATLGGSGKTRVALAVVRALAASGMRVALVGHAYRASPARARVVSSRDALAEVGDEALSCARALDLEPGAWSLEPRAWSLKPEAFVAPTRQEAVDLAAARGAQLIVLDGPLQTKPARAALSILAVDRDAPWGSGAVAPAGDLRAPREALLAASDLVVEVDATPSDAILERLRGVRFGLFTALARPSRLVRALARRGLFPSATVEVSDHGPFTRRAAREIRAAQSRVDLWLATPKCALHFDCATPLLVLEDRLCLTPSHMARLAALATEGVSSRVSPT